MNPLHRDRDEERARSGPRWGQLIGAALLYGALATAGVFVGAFLPMPLIVLGAKLLIDRLAPRTNAPFLPLATSAGALCAAPVLFWRAHAEVESTLRESASVGPFWWVFLPLVLFPAVAFGTCLASIPLAAGRPAAFARSARRAALAVTVVLAVLVAGAGAVLAFRPGLDQYKSEGMRFTVRTPAVPRAGLVPAPTAHMHGYPPGMLPGIEYRRGPPGTKIDPFEAFTVVQQCDEERCRVGVLRPGAELSEEDELVDAPALETTETISLLYQPRAKVVLFQDCCASRIEFEQRDGRFRPSPFSTARAVSRAGPPLSWTVAAGVALLLVVGLWVGARRATTRQQRALAAAKPGMLDTDGWITVEAGPVLQADPNLDLSPGPVVVFGVASGAAYRDPQGLLATDVLPGTLAEHLEGLAFRKVRHDATIAAVASLAAAPLAAAVVGLVMALGGASEPPVGTPSAASSAHASTPNVAPPLAPRVIELLDVPASLCRAPDRPDHVWLVMAGKGDLVVDLSSGEATRPVGDSACAPASSSGDWTVACQGERRKPCGLSTESELSALEKERLSPIVVFRTESVTLVVADRSTSRGPHTVEEPFVAALDARLSTVLWQHPAAPGRGGAGRAGSAAALASGLLIMTYSTGGPDGHVAAFDATSGERRWTFRVDDDSRAPPSRFIVTRERFYVPSAAGLEVLDLRSGAHLGTIDGS